MKRLKKWIELFAVFLSCYTIFFGLLWVVIKLKVMTVEYTDFGLSLLSIVNYVSPLIISTIITFLWSSN